MSTTKSARQQKSGLPPAIPDRGRHQRFPLLIMSAKVTIARIWRVEIWRFPQFLGCMQAVLIL
jgi:hypothetical protein